MSGAAAAGTDADKSGIRRPHPHGPRPRPPARVSSTADAPSRRPVSSAGRRSRRLSCRESFDSELGHRLEELHLQKDDVSRNSKIVNELSDIILNELKQSRRYPVSFKWEKLNSGSYYDKTKV